MRSSRTKNECPTSLECKRQQDGLVHRDRERAHDDVIARRHIIGRIESEVIPAAIIDLVRMKISEFPIRPGIAEIKRELLRLHIHRAENSDPAG